MWDGRVGAELAGRDHATYYRQRFADLISRGVTKLMIGNSTRRSYRTTLSIRST